MCFAPPFVHLAITCKTETKRGGCKNTLEGKVIHKNAGRLATEWAHPIELEKINKEHTAFHCAAVQLSDEVEKTAPPPFYLALVPNGGPWHCDTAGELKVWTGFLWVANDFLHTESFSLSLSLSRSLFLTLSLSSLPSDWSQRYNAGGRQISSGRVESRLKRAKDGELWTLVYVYVREWSGL